MKRCTKCSKLKMDDQFHMSNGKRRADCKDCYKSNNRRKNPRSNAISRISYMIAGGSRAFYALGGPERAAIRTQATSLHEAGHDFVTAVQARKTRVDGFVYVITHARLDGVKIGRAFDADSRLKSYQTGCPRREYKLAYVSPYSEDCVALEKAVHALLDDHRLEGEWFNLTPQEAAEAVTGAYNEDITN